MRLPLCAVNGIWQSVKHHAERVPDEIIGHNARWRATRPDGAPVTRPFLLRWYVHPKNHVTNTYLHQFIRDDEDRALHDHPWFNLSILLGGQYIEHTVSDGGVHERRIYRAGAIKLRSPWSAHRVELTADGSHGPLMNGTPEHAPKLPGWVTYSDRGPSWSLFVTGPKQHEWGFHCPQAGWRSSHLFHDKGGCDE